MAISKTTIKNTNQETVVKVVGGAGESTTVELDTDIVASTQVVDGATQTAYITGLVWTGGTNGIITITRGGATIAVLQANAAGALDFSGQGMSAEVTNSTSDIGVAIATADCQLWMRLKKVGGYASKVEYEQYGSYEDETRVGASTTKPGSPDYAG